MGDDGLNIPHWGSLGSSINRQYDLQLGPMPGVSETRAFVPNGQLGFNLNEIASYYPYSFYNGQQASPIGYAVNNAPPILTDYVKDSWLYQRGQRERFVEDLTGANPRYGVMPELALSTHTIPMVMGQPVKAASLGMLEESVIPKTLVPMQRSQHDVEFKLPKMRKQRKEGSVTERNGGSAKRIKQPRKSVDVVVNGITMDISRIPIPVCSCTGTPQQCYRWGSGGWQSACCTTMLSEYPLPMSTKRRGARIAGRKMSVGAFKKVLEKLASEGYDFSNAIDLKTHWAKHGTNKFVTIR
ncbi:hypothetical protein QQ045_016856 [Rhodiola kirilowii]